MLNLILLEFSITMTIDHRPFCSKQNLNWLIIQIDQLFFFFLTPVAILVKSCFMRKAG